MESHSHQWPR